LFSLYKLLKTYPRNRDLSSRSIVSMADVSALGPIDPASITEGGEKEKSAPWIVRKLVGVSQYYAVLTLGRQAVTVLDGLGLSSLDSSIEMKILTVTFVSR